MEKGRATRGRRARPVPPGAAVGAGPARDERSKTVRDDRWPSEARVAGGCAALLFGLLLAVDAAAGALSTAHVAAWCFLAVLLFVVMLPRRIRAGEGWVASRGLLREQRIRTDRLVSVRWPEGVGRRLVLRDADGGRVELDPRALLASPQLWHRVETDAMACLDAGTLLYGADTLRRVSERLDRDTARTVFRASGLD
jgi:hypothetical protein